jgi:hypothetical protein
VRVAAAEDDDMYSQRKEGHRGLSRNLGQEPPGWPPKKYDNDSLPAVAKQHSPRIHSHRRHHEMPSAVLARSSTPCCVQLSSYTRRALRSCVPAALSRASRATVSCLRDPVDSRAAPGSLAQRLSCRNAAGRPRVATLAAAAEGVAPADDRIPCTVSSAPRCRWWAPALEICNPRCGGRRCDAPRIASVRKACAAHLQVALLAGGHRLPGLRQDDAAEPHPHAAARQAHRCHRERGGRSLPGRLPAPDQHAAFSPHSAHLTPTQRALCTQPHCSRKPLHRSCPHPHPTPPCPQFGEIDIDSELVARSEVLEGTQDTVLMLNNGCLCCTVGARSCCRCCCSPGRPRRAHLAAATRRGAGHQPSEGPLRLLLLLAGGAPGALAPSMRRHQLPARPAARAQGPSACSLTRGAVACCLHPPPPPGAGRPGQGAQQPVGQAPPVRPHPDRDDWAGQPRAHHHLLLPGPGPARQVRVVQGRCRDGAALCRRGGAALHQPARRSRGSGSMHWLAARL